MMTDEHKELIRIVKLVLGFLQTTGADGVELACHTLRVALERNSHVEDYPQ
jgi:hypothetical protein